ncbi:DUF4157 domain-containing protein [Sphingomonas sp. DG1-23]|uniref:DUF4157 domain-containing protein n=1 Tax=Sphingomonas sp. DG1-23 TaxID=3068316 RepID=UPI00273D6A05|nr:DUF4157 domain-containing protein [Sphingomonas sp. DG1-23]MDP5280611.1 DUF4157 domain-containing protein [Sphingomonas sp. DG1-23]
MAGQVIQGFFLGGRMPVACAVRPAVAQPAVAGMPRPGPPRPAFVHASATVQQRPAPGRPLQMRQPGQVAQRFGGNEGTEIDPVAIGLVRSGGQPLPQRLLAKMEAAFGADFSSVRVHVGPQASRIGAIAFTTGNDLYFAPGQFQPESVKGQQLIGHELAHVIQQRQGRVRASGNGVAVVQDHALEAEADRLGMRAAMQPSATGLVQRKIDGASRGVSPRPGRPPLVHAASDRAATSTRASIQRMEMDLENYGGGQSQKIFGLPSDWEKSIKKKSATKMEKMFSSGENISEARDYGHQRAKQMLRWVASLLYKYYPNCVEIQCYYRHNYIYVSSNKNSVNNKMRQDLAGGMRTLLKTAFEASYPKNMDKDFRKRIKHHGKKLLSKTLNDGQEDVWDAIRNNRIIVPNTLYDVDLHAERRIQEHLGIKLNKKYLGGVKRACTVCAIDLDLTDLSVGPFWPSKAALGGYDKDHIKETMEDEEIFSHVTKSKRTGKLTTDYDSDSDSGTDEYL